MVMVRLQDNAAFETAYFVLRDSYERKGGTDIVTEANALAEEAFAGGRRGPKATPRPSLLGALLLFLSGLLLGALVASLLWLAVWRN